MKVVLGLWIRFAVAFLSCQLIPALAFADAKSDLSITAKGICASGATAFVIINSNSNNGIHATVTQTTVVAGQTSSSTLDILLKPSEQKSLGCSAQDSKGNFQVSWQVQTAEYQ